MAAARRSKSEWRDLVERWRRSGQGRREFARSVGVNPSTLSWWCWKLQHEAPAFLEVVVSEPEPSPDFELEVAGVRVRVPLGFDAHELRRLVDALC